MGVRSAVGRLESWRRGRIRGYAALIRHISLSRNVDWQACAYLLAGPETGSSLLDSSHRH
jgi:hypothetical protein